jgi:subtilisin family serine protease
MRRSPTLAIPLLLAAGSLFAQEPSRLDPRLRGPFLRMATPAAEARTEGEPGGVPVRPLPGPSLLAAPVVAGVDGRPTVRVLARLGPGGEEALVRHGARIGTRAGDVVTLRIPVDALGAVAAEPAVRFLEAASWLEPSVPRGPVAAEGTGETLPANDAAIDDIGLDGLRRRTGDRFFGLAGQGVLIGIFDTGLDLTHEDFRDRDGRTRVVVAWDQTSSAGRPPGVVGDHTLDYGTECTRAEIDAGNCPLTDTAGHGTHVAGIAAGDGSATGNGEEAYRFTGVAPAAELIIVRGGQTGFTSDQLLDGVAYIFARAAELGRPVVVNLSVTTQSGPHDGTTLMERGLDQLSGPGRIIVAGAGNQGVNANESPAFVRAPMHAMGVLALGASATDTLIVPPYTPRAGAYNDGAVLELWYDGRDSLAVTVAPPGEPGITVATGDSALALTPSGTIYVSNGADGPQAINGDNVALIAIADSIAEHPPKIGRWTITVTRTGGTGTGEYHLWLIGGTFDNPADLAKLSGNITNSHVVGSPATADRVIAVAAHATKHEWKGEGGEPQSFPTREPLGDIAFFSSPGPRRDGVLKPEISAPGKVVISARARDGETWKSLPWLVEADGVHGGLIGTSMSAPFVTGAVALLLQLDPTLTPERAREILAGSARRDAFVRQPHTGEPPGVPNAQWGYGKLDIGAAVRLLRPDGGLAPGERVNLSANPVRTGELVVRYAERPKELAIYAFTGERVRSFGPGEIGDFLTVWDLKNDAGRPVANGAYLLLIDVAGERMIKKIFVVRP